MPRSHGPKYSMTFYSRTLHWRHSSTRAWVVVLGFARAGAWVTPAPPRPWAPPAHVTLFAFVMTVAKCVLTFPIPNPKEPRASAVLMFEHVTLGVTLRVPGTA
jgi:hypothetical protein